MPSTGTYSLATLISIWISPTFGGAETFQLPPRSQGTGIDSHHATEYGGRQLFGDEWNYPSLDDFLESGGEVRRIKLGTDASVADEQLSAPEILGILFVVKGTGRVQVITSSNTEPLRDVAPGDTVIALVDSSN